MIIVELFKRKDSPYYHAHISFENFKGRYRYSTETTGRKLAYRNALVKGEEILGQLDKRKRKRTFDEALEKYLRGHIKSKGSDAVNRTHKYIGKRLFEYFGGKVLNDITVGVISDYVDHRRQTNVKNATIKRELNDLKAILNKANGEWEWLEKMPRFPKIPETPPRVRWLTINEMSDFIEKCYDVAHNENNRFDDLGDLVVTAFDTGMRKSELLNLDIAQGDVDLDQRLLIIRKSKNKHMRNVPMTKRVHRIMSQRVDDFHSGLKLCSHVFSYDDRPVKNFSKSFRTALDLAKIDDFRPHDMRHTFASHLVQRGVSLKAVQELLGHRKLEMVMVYAHLAKGQHHASIAALEEYSPENSEILSRDIVGAVEKRLGDRVSRFMEDLLSLPANGYLLKKLAESWHRSGTVAKMSDFMSIEETSNFSIFSMNYNGAGEEIRTLDFNLGKEGKSILCNCFPMIF